MYSLHHRHQRASSTSQLQPTMGNEIKAEHIYKLEPSTFATVNNNVNVPKLRCPRCQPMLLANMFITYMTAAPSSNIVPPTPTPNSIPGAVHATASYPRRRQHQHLHGCQLQPRLRKKNIPKPARLTSPAAATASHHTDTSPSSTPTTSTSTLARHYPRPHGR